MRTKYDEERRRHTKYKNQITEEKTKHRHKDSNVHAILFPPKMSNTDFKTIYYNNICNMHISYFT